MAKIDRGHTIYTFQPLDSINCKMFTKVVKMYGFEAYAWVQYISGKWCSTVHFGSLTDDEWIEKLEFLNKLASRHNSTGRDGL